MNKRTLNLLRKAHTGKGRITVIPQKDTIMKFLNMDLLSLEKGEASSLGEPERELGLVILGGHCLVALPGCAETVLKARSKPFIGWPHAVYIPAGENITIKALTSMEAVIFGTPAERGEKVQIISPDDIEVLKIGAGNWYLEGTFIIYDKVPSKRLIVGETHIPAGNWCSSPPHSHEKDVAGIETQLEEIYYFRFQPSQGFGFQGVYTLDGEIEAAYLIHDGDVVLVPRGMHPNVAGPGYEMYMLWGMAVQKIKNANPDWIMPMVAGNDYVMFLKQFFDFGLK
ncbi:MAG: 5-deoxy-glucuronate isomerase, partial [Spirochaetota bacterium]